MNIPCDIPCITCDPPPPGASGLGLAPNDPSNPFVNLSSEAPDIDLFLGRNYGGKLPPLGSTWYAVGCLGFCLSSESQDDADVCAENQSVFCQSVNWPTVIPLAPGQIRCPDGSAPVNGMCRTTRQTYSNSVQFCSFTCPDGNLFTFTVAAGFFAAFSVAAANALAYSYACNKARLNRICFGEMNNRRTCLSGEMSSNVSVSSVNLPIAFDIVSGALPPGTFPTQSSPTTFVISGNPTMAGDYPIRLRATDSFGNFMEKDFSVSVFGITDDAELPDATSGSEYTHQLNYAGTPAGAVVFSLVGGAFPDGVTMDSSGLISGTPTVDGAFQVTVRISDGVKNCDKTFDLFSETSAISAYWSFDKPGEPTILSPTNFQYTDDKSGLVLTSIFWPSTGLSGPVPGYIANGFRSHDGITSSLMISSDPVTPILGWEDLAGSGITLWAWIKFEVVNSTEDGLLLVLSEDALSEVGFRLNKNANTITFQAVFNGAGSSVDVPFNSFPIETQFIFLCGTYDKDTGLTRLYVNGDAPLVSSLAASFPAYVNGGALMGSISANATNVDELGVDMKRCFTDAQVLELYNGGSGMTWPEVDEV